MEAITSYANDVKYIKIAYLLYKTDGPSAATDGWMTYKNTKIVDR